VSFPLQQKYIDFTIVCERISNDGGTLKKKWSPRMSQPKSEALNHMFLPRSRYRGTFTPSNLVFNANLQEFAHRINYICALESNGKLAPDEAYRQIQELWQALKASKKALGIGTEPPIS